MKNDLMKRAGIEDEARFYRDRFLSGSIFEASYFDAIDRFDIKFARTMWIYDNVRRGSSLLDLGCGEGVLALLKRKDVYLAGVDLSPDLVAQARRNGYDAACVGLLTDLPFPTGVFRLRSQSRRLRATSVLMRKIGAEGDQTSVTPDRRDDARHRVVGSRSFTPITTR